MEVILGVPRKASLPSQRSIRPSRSSARKSRKKTGLTSSTPKRWVFLPLREKPKLKITADRILFHRGIAKYVAVKSVTEEAREVAAAEVKVGEDIVEVPK
jgi:hypothetical protein